MYKITDITPFMKDGWVAMDKSGEWTWWEKEPTHLLTDDMWTKPYPNSSGWRTLSLMFDIAPADDWTKSLIRIDNEKREKLKEEFNNNIKKVLSND